jgi:hypothetical protein
MWLAVLAVTSLVVLYLIFSRGVRSRNTPRLGSVVEVENGNTLNDPSTHTHIPYQQNPADRNGLNVISHQEPNSGELSRMLEALKLGPNEIDELCGARVSEDISLLAARKLAEDVGEVRLCQVALNPSSPYPERLAALAALSTLQLGGSTCDSLAQTFLLEMAVKERRELTRALALVLATQPKPVNGQALLAVSARISRGDHVPAGVVGLLARSLLVAGDEINAELTPGVAAGDTPIEASMLAALCFLQDREPSEQFALSQALDGYETAILALPWVGSEVVGEGLAALLPSIREDKGGALEIGAVMGIASALGGERGANVVADWACSGSVKQVQQLQLVITESANPKCFGTFWRLIQNGDVPLSIRKACRRNLIRWASALDNGALLPGERTALLNAINELGYDHQSITGGVQSLIPEV